MKLKPYHPESGGTFEHNGTPVDVEFVKTDLRESGYAWFSTTEGVGTLGPYDSCDQAATAAIEFLDAGAAR